VKESIASFINDTLNSLSVRFIFRKEQIKDRWKLFIEKHKDSLISLAIFLGISLCIFGYSLVTTNFKIPLSGDGYIQEQNFPYKFYDDWHEFFRTGHFPNWDTSSAIGTNNIGGNTFYSLLSPFMLPMLIFPRSWIQVELGIKYFVQTTLACYFFYMYLKEFKLSIWTRRVGGVAYGFSGALLYFIWFEHFLDSFVLLPLVLLGVERVIRYKDPRLLLVSLFLQGITNYFFLVIFCVGGALYSIWRYFTLWRYMGTWKARVEVIFIGVFAFLFGILASGIVLLPGIMNALKMPRVTSASYLDTLKDLIKNGSIKDILKHLVIFDVDFTNLYALNGFIFAPTHSYSNNLVGPNYYDNLSGSSFIYTPLMLFLFMGVIYGIRKGKPSYILGFICVSLIIICPFFYYMFSAFTVGYARFLIVPSAWMITFVSIQLEEKDKFNRIDLTLAFLIVIVLQILSTYLSYQMIIKNPSVFDKVEEKWLRFILVPLEMVYAIISYIVLMTQLKKGKLGIKVLAMVAFEAIAIGNVILYYQGYGDDNSIEVQGRGEDILSRETEIVEALEDYDSSMYRIQNPSVGRWNTNTHMKVGHNGLSAFNSNYAFDSQDFLDWSRVPYTYHNWSMGLHNRRINVEEFLGVKYYLVAKRDLNVPYGFENVMDIDAESITDPNEKKAFLNLQKTIKENYENDTQENSIARELYVNTDYVNFAFAFDSIMNSSKYSSSYYADFNEFGYLNTGIVDSDVYSEVSTIANKLGITVNSNVTSSQSNFASTDFKVSIISENEETAELSVYLGANGTYYTVDATKSLNSLNQTVYLFDGYDGKMTITSSSYVSFEGFGLTEAKTGYKGTDGYYSFSRVPLVKMNSTKVTCYPSTWDGTKIIDGETPYDMKTMENSQRKGMNQHTKVVIEEQDGSMIASSASEEFPVYISLQTPNEWTWHFYDAEGNEIYLSGDKAYSADYQNAYGFYVRKPISKIVGDLKWTVSESTIISVPYIYTQSYSMYKLGINKLNEEPIEMISSSSDRYNFKTNYSKAKYVVLNNPLMDGWKLQKVRSDGSLQDANIYKSQGGFVGFFDDGGEHEYILSYSSPGINTGFKLSFIGLMGMLFMSCIYVITYNNNELKRFPSMKIKKTFDKGSAR